MSDDLRVGNSGSVGGVASLGTCTSVNFIFAKLQMELAASAKEAAMGYITEIQKTQQEQKKVADMINKLRDLQTNADAKGTSAMGTFTKDNAEKELLSIKDYITKAKELQTQAGKNTKSNFESSGEYESTMMPSAMEQYFKDNKISYDDSGKSARQNKSEWEQAINSLKDRKSALEVFSYMDTYGLTYNTGSSKDDLDVALQSLKARQETIGTDIQTKMVYVQDFMGQYNSYTQGANSAIQSGMQTLTAVARGQ